MMDIRANEQEIERRKSAIEQLKIDLEEHVEDTEAGERVGKLKDELKIAQEDLAMELKRKPGVNNLMEEIAAEKEILKGLQITLSDLLVTYFSETKERQVQIADDGRAKDVVISAKLSKDEHQYQTSIFNPDNRE